ncbi:MAG: efflux RND transporter periplasmic adaptor subunit, partial [Cellulosilyticaceae bacterium]
LLIGGIAVTGVVGRSTTAAATNLRGPKNGQIVKVATAGITDIQSKVAASGVLEAQDEQIIYAEGNNQVETVHKSVGDQVKKGDLILSFKTDSRQKLERELEKLGLQMQNAQIALDQLQSHSKSEVLNAQSNVSTIKKAIDDLEQNSVQTQRNVESTQKDLETAQKDYALIKELYDNGLAAEKELITANQQITTLTDRMSQLNESIDSLSREKETTQLKYETAIYNLEVLQGSEPDQTKIANIKMKQNEIKNLELQKVGLLEDLEKAQVKVTAPADGIITELTLEAGQLVSGGSILFKTIDPTVLKVECGISPYYATQLEVGLEAVIKYNGSRVIEIPGEISQIAPMAQTQSNGTSQTTTLPIEVSVAGDLKGLKPGLVVDVKIITEDVKDVVAVPLLATMEDQDGETYLFVVKDDFTLEKRYVKQGASNNTFVQVSDVKEGEQVVTNPTEALETGTVVNYQSTQTEDGVLND